MKLEHETCTKNRMKTNLKPELIERIKNRIENDKVIVGSGSVRTVRRSEDGSQTQCQMCLLGIIADTYIQDHEGVEWDGDRSQGIERDGSVIVDGADFIPYIVQEWAVDGGREILVEWRGQQSGDVWDAFDEKLRDVPGRLFDPFSETTKSAMKAAAMEFISNLEPVPGYGGAT